MVYEDHYFVNPCNHPNTLYYPRGCNYRIQELEKSLLGIGNDINKKNVLLVGDFNLPNINWEENIVQYKSGYSSEAAEKLIDLAGTHGLEQMVTEPTSVTPLLMYYQMLQGYV